MRVLTLCLVFLLGACASQPEQVPEPAPTAQPAPAPAPEPVASSPVAIAPSPSAEAVTPTRVRPVPAGRPGSLLSKVNRSRLAAQMQQASKPINIRHRCSFRNETGYNGSTQVEIANNVVKTLATSISVPLHGGSCNFESAGFRQTARTPSIEMKQADGCTVRIWTQGPQLTISYSKCEARCSKPEVFKYIWPVLIDQPSGKCD